jgi:hypothetical protein
MIWSRYPIEPLQTFDPYVSCCGRVCTPLGGVAAGYLTTRSSVDHICLSSGIAKQAAAGAWEAAQYESGRLITDHNGVFVDISY